MLKQKAKRENVRVVCRVRPSNQKEVASGGITCVKNFADNLGAIEVNFEDSQNNFQFDRIFGQDSTQSDVFEDTAVHLINDVLMGYNATVFAYGQTGIFSRFTKNSCSLIVYLNRFLNHIGNINQ